MGAVQENGRPDPEGTPTSGSEHRPHPDDRVAPPQSRTDGALAAGPSRPPADGLGPAQGEGVVSAPDPAGVADPADSRAAAAVGGAPGSPGGGGLASTGGDVLVPPDREGDPAPPAPGSPVVMAGAGRPDGAPAEAGGTGSGGSVTAGVGVPAGGAPSAPGLTVQEPGAWSRSAAPAGPAVPEQLSSPYPSEPRPPAGAFPPVAPPRRWAWATPAAGRTHRWGLGAYLLAEAVFLLVSALIGLLLVDPVAPSVEVLAFALAAPTVLAAATGLLITRLRGNGPRIDLGLRWSRRDFGLGLAFGFGGLALTIPASLVYVQIVGEDASSAVGEVFGGIRAGPALAVLVLVLVVLVAPACEEILYRGLLWGGLEKIAGRWVAFVVSTLLFALAHFELTRTPLLFVVAIPIAIARLYTGRLLASIVAHQVNNLLPGIMLVLGLLGVLPVA